MGVDLKVMASHFRERRGELLPTATLRFDRDAALFAQLASDATPCLVRPLPEGMTVGTYEDEGLRYTTEDRHGHRLTYTTGRSRRSRRLARYRAVEPGDSRVPPHPHT